MVRSRELTSALGTLAGVLVLGSLSVPFVISWRGVLEASLLFSTHSDLSQGQGTAMADLMKSCILPLWLPVALVLGSSAGGNAGRGHCAERRRAV